jgi:hypothetical protein
MVPQDAKDKMVRKVNPDQLEEVVSTDHQDRKESLDFQDMDKKEMLVCQV